jgi:hypothetical protein
MGLTRPRPQRAPVASSGLAPENFEAGGRRFEPCRAYQVASRLGIAAPDLSAWLIHVRIHAGGRVARAHRAQDHDALIEARCGMVSHCGSAPRPGQVSWCASPSRSEGACTLVEAQGGEPMRKAYGRWARGCPHRPHAVQTGHIPSGNGALQRASIETLRPSPVAYSRPAHVTNCDRQVE